MRKRGRHEEEALAREQPSRGEEIAEDRGLSGAALRLQELVGNTAAAAVLSRAELQRDAAPAKPAPEKEKTKEGGGTTYTLTVSGVGTFELLSFSWGTTGSGVGGGGGGPGKHQTKDVVCSKHADEHTAKLMQHAAEGRPIDEVKLVAKNKDGTITFTFKSVHITSYQTGGSTGDVKPVETFSFEGGSMQVEQPGGGGQAPGGGGAEWDLTPYPG